MIPPHSHVSEAFMESVENAAAKEFTADAVVGFINLPPGALTSEILTRLGVRIYCVFRFA
jgi:hypothetical protein